MRRIWGIPSRTQNNLIHHISKSSPPVVIFRKRFIKFFGDSLGCSNNVVNYIFKSAMTQDSRIGNNIRFILYELGLPMDCDLSNMTGMTKKLCDTVLERWNSGHDEADKRLGEHILELIERSDSIETWILDKKELQDVIDMLCTA